MTDEDEAKDLLAKSLQLLGRDDLTPERRVDAGVYALLGRGVCMEKIVDRATENFARLRRDSRA